MSDILNQATPTRVFLSYARGDDEPFVKRLYADLVKAGFTVWFDRESLMSRGLTFHQEIKDAILTEVDRVIYVGGRRRRFPLMCGRNGSLLWSVITWLSPRFGELGMLKMCRVS